MQDLRTVLAADRGAMRYPSYTVHKTRPAFSSRQQLLEYETALEQAAALDAALEVRPTPIVAIT